MNRTKLTFILISLVLMLTACSSKEVSIIDKTGRAVSVSSTEDDTYTFSIPSAKKENSVGWENPFKDVDKDDWFYNAVRYCHENGLMSGTSSTTFSPSEGTSRGMIVSILWRLEGSPFEALPSFSDVDKSQYYADAVGWAYANNIVSGFGEDEFRPDQVITREQLASILFRYAKFKGWDTSLSVSLDGYNDVASVSDYAKEAVAWADTHSVINGFDDTLIAPQGDATRANVASILMNLCENASR